MITELLRDRFSVRRFRDKAISDGILGDVLEAGRLSPSGGNEQPWIFGVVSDRRLIAEIAESACHQPWIAEARILIVLCTICVSDERGGRDIQKRRFPEYRDVIDRIEQDVYWALNQEEHQTKIAGAHMALAALEHGVGSCWVSLFEVKRIATLLNLPDGYLPSEILAFGYPEEGRKATGKKPISEVVFFNAFR